MALHSRVKRINEEIRSGVASILMTEIKDPRVQSHLITVTGVDTSNDLQQTTVWVSIYGSDEEAEDALAGLQRSRGYIKRMLGERIVMKYLPDVHFKLDKSGRHADHINRLLKQVEKQSPPQAEAEAESPTEAPKDIG